MFSRPHLSTKSLQLPKFIVTHSKPFSFLLTPTCPSSPVTSCRIVSLFIFFFNRTKEKALEVCRARRNTMTRTNSISIVDPVSWGEVLERKKNMLKEGVPFIPGGLVYPRKQYVASGRREERWICIILCGQERKQREGERWWNVGMTRGWEWRYCSSARSYLDRRRVMTICFSVLLFFSLPASK